MTRCSASPTGSPPALCHCTSFLKGQGELQAVALPFSHHPRESSQPSSTVLSQVPRKDYAHRVK